MLELLLRVECDDGSNADVRAEVTADHTVAELAATIAIHLGATGRVHRVLTCRRLGTRLTAEQPVVETGLVSGDRVRVGPDDGTVDGGIGFAGPDERGLAPDAAGLVCDVVGGPSGGTSVSMGHGDLVIGRDVGCDVILDDLTVSKRHAVVHGDRAGGIAVERIPEATNAVLVDGEMVARTASVALGSVVQLGASALVIRPRGPVIGVTPDQLGQIPFNRTPCRCPHLEPVEIRGPGRPPAPYEPRPFLLLATVVPLLGGIVFAVWLERPEFLLFAALGPLSMLSSWWSDRRRGGAGHREQMAGFEQRYADWIARYDEALADERGRRASAAPDIADLARRVELRRSDLWPRSRRTDAFLQLRMGLGDASALTTTTLPGGSDSDPDGRIERAVSVRRVLASVPITVDLLDRGVLAVHGARDAVESSVASSLLQAAALHSPDDLVVCGYFDSVRRLRDGAMWIPHTRSVASPLEGEHLAVGSDAADDLLRRMSGIVARRHDASEHWPRMLLLLDGLVDADARLVSSVLERGPSVGVVAVWFGEDAAQLPRQATAVLECPAVSAGRRATFWTTAPTGPTVELAPDRLGPDAASRLARALAPLRDATSASAAASIPRLVPLLESLGTPTLDVEEVVTRWSQATGPGLDVPIGVGPAGALRIDLVQHGPHALIAGTSGSGKSELLQSIIAAMIADHPPTRLNLLFIDYKGGASSSVFQPVPHTVGHVTNLDAGLAMRALVSLRAELDRRMRMLEGRAKDLGEMVERFPDGAPPRLVIVVDEFATLVGEVPDFVAGMVDIAQRGRSLGIHLILATQRPAGAVSDDILANTNLRISLRVLDPADSSSVLGSTEAAAIPVPLRGRGFARLGAEDVIEFQSAYSGASFTASAGATPVVVSGFPEAGDVTVHPRPEPVADTGAPTHLDVVLASVVGAASRLGYGRGRRPWMEDLPHHLDLDAVLAGTYGPIPDHVPGRDVVLGVRDQPEDQAQRPERIDLEAAGGLLVFGTAGSGRTTVLRTALGSAFTEITPAEVEAYLLDFGGRALEPLRHLPHVAAVASGDDLEQVARVLMYLQAEVGRRQTILTEHRAENLTVHNRQRPDAALPRLLLVVDGYEAFGRTFERGELYMWHELLLETVLAGRAVGLHLLATADRRVGVPAGLANAISGRVILRPADADGLLDHGISASVARSARLGDGRALVPGGASVQIAVVGEDVSNAGQSAWLEARSCAGGDGHSAALAKLPDAITVSELVSAGPLGSMSFTLGIADLTSEPVVGDVRRQHLVVIGPGESGRSTTLRTVARALYEGGGDVWVIADADSPLSYDAWNHCAMRRDEQRRLVEALARVAAAVARPPVLLIDAVEQLDDGVGAMLEPLLRDDLVRVVAGAAPGTLRGYVTGWMTAMKDSRQMLLLQPDELGDVGALTPVRIRLRPAQSFPPGRGVFVTGRRWQLVQVAREEAVGRSLGRKQRAVS